MAASLFRLARFGLVVLLAAAAPVAAQAPTPEPPPGGMVEEDLDQAAEPVAPAPGDPAALQAQAEQAYSDGDLPRAVGLYRQLAAASPDAPARARHLVTAAWLAFQLGDPTAARNDLSQALFEDPATPFRAELYAPEFVALHQDSLAEAVVRRRRTAAERLSQAVQEIADARYGEARTLLEEGLALAPDDPDGLYNLALVDLRTGRREAALAGFERVLALERGNPEGVSRELKSQALNNAAVIYFQLEQYADAETALAEAVRLQPFDGKSWYNLGLTRGKLNKRDEALTALRRARELDPTDFEIARQLGVAYLERADWSDAAAVLTQAARDQPETPDLWMHLGRAQRGLGNAAAALESFDRAIALDPDNRHGFAEPAALLAAESRLAQGDVAGAGAAAEKAVQWNPGKPDGWMLLGLARFEGGDVAGAQQALEKAAEIGPQRADVAHNLGSVYLAQKNVAAAEASFRRALELDPASEGTLDILARIEAQKVAPTPTPAPKGGKTTRRSSRNPPAPPPAPARPPSQGLGARLTAVDSAELGLKGLRVEEVTVGGAAARAGIRVGDLIQRADGKAYTNALDFNIYLASAKGPVRLDILRQGRSLTILFSLS
jgi:tetratricopeptide (TPR) repeat protein